MRLMSQRLALIGAGMLTVGMMWAATFTEAR